MKIKTKAMLNALCMADFGDSGTVDKTVPSIPPRRVDVMLQSKPVIPAKITFEK